MLRDYKQRVALGYKLSTAHQDRLVLFRIALAPKTVLAPVLRQPCSRAWRQATHVTIVAQQNKNKKSTLSHTARAETQRFVPART